MNFEDSTFTRFTFTQQQIKRNFTNALRDFDIAKKDSILDVKFNYSYNALIKAGIALLSYYQVKVKSRASMVLSFLAFSMSVFNFFLFLICIIGSDFIHSE